MKTLALSAVLLFSTPAHANINVKDIFTLTDPLLGACSVEIKEMRPDLHDDLTYKRFFLVHIRHCSRQDETFHVTADFPTDVVVSEEQLEELRD